MFAFKFWYLLLLSINYSAVCLGMAGTPSEFQTFNIVFYRNSSSYTDAAAFCVQRNSSLLEISSDLVEKLKLLVVAEYVKRPEPMNASIWAKDENLLRIEYKNNTNGNETYLNLTTKSLQGEPEEMHTFVCVKASASCSFSSQAYTTSNGTRNESCSCDDVTRQSTDTCDFPESPKPPNILPPPVQCQAKTVDGFYFPETIVNTNAISSETCSTDTSTATIACRGRAGRGSFIDSSLVVIPCNITFDEVEIEVNDSESVAKSFSQLRIISSRSQTSDLEGANNTTENNTTSNTTENNTIRIVNLVSEIGQRVVRNNIEVQPTTFQSVLSITSSVSRDSKNLSPSQRSELVKSVERISTQVVLDITNSSVNIRTELIEAQINLINFTSAEETITLPKINEANLDVLSTLKIELPARSLSEQFSKERVNIIVYKDDSLFKSEQGSAPPIVAILVGNRSRVELDEEISIEFKNHYNSTYGRETPTEISQDTLVTRVNFTEKKCAYWNFTDSSWNFDGCRLDITELSSGTCKCTHLTNFAILISIHRVPSDVSLNIATKVGCSIILIALFITIAFYLTDGKLRQSLPTKIQLNIFCNLFVAYLVFVVGIGRVEVFMACNVITAILHYTFLTSFFWMSVYCHSMYRSMLDVLKGISDKYIWKAAAFAYGIPAFIVAFNILLATLYLDARDYPPYYPVNAVRPNSSYFHDTACWLNVNSLYYSFLLIVGLLLLYNLVVVILVSKKVLLNKQQAIRSTKKQKSKSKQLLLVFSLSFTVGLNWCLGFFLLITPDPTYQRVVAWIFTIVTSLQGLLILYFNCIKRMLKSAGFQSRVSSFPKPFTSYSNKDLNTASTSEHVSSFSTSKI